MGREIAWHSEDPFMIKFSIFWIKKVAFTFGDSQSLPNSLIPWSDSGIWEVTEISQPFSQKRLVEHTDFSSFTLNCVYSTRKDLKDWTLIWVWKRGLEVKTMNLESWKFIKKKCFLPGSKHIRASVDFLNIDLLLNSLCLLRCLD